MLYKVRYYDIEVPYYIFYGWLEENCQGKFYTGYEWDSPLKSGQTIPHCVQFEHEKDATMFAMRWL